MRILQSLFFAVAAFLFLGIGSAFACHEGNASTCIGPHGVPIPALEHGQMVTLQDHASAIISQADQLLATHTYANPADRAELALLEQFTLTERLYGFGALLPGTIDNENSLFHRPVHGYLAGSLMMLKHMHATAPTNTAVTALYDTVTNAMLANGTDVALCSYSGLAFDVDNPVGPDWPVLGSPMHRAQLGLAMLLIAGVAFNVVMLWRRNNHLQFA